MEDDRATAESPDLVTVELPRLRVSAYLRWAAWWHEAQSALLSDPSLDAVARANGVTAFDPHAQLMTDAVMAPVMKDAATAVDRGEETMAPVASATLRQWSEGLSRGERLSAWMDRLSDSSVERIPQPSDEIRDVRAQMMEAIRRQFEDRSS